MTATFPVYLRIATKYYRIEATQVKRTLKNKAIYVPKPLSKANQNGTNVPSTIAVDLKKITDNVAVIGFIPAQDTSATRVGDASAVSPTFTETTQKNSVDVFEDMISDFKRLPGPYYFNYKGKTYTVLIDQLEHTDRSNRIQTSKVNSTIRENFPQRVDVSINFTICDVR